MFHDVKQRRRTVGIVALLLWLASLGLPAATFATPGYEYVPGGLVAAVWLLFGWALFQIGAYANLIFLPVVIIMIMGKRPWLVAVLLMVAAGWWSFTWPSFPDDVHTNEVQHFASGFYAWQAALLLPLLELIWEWLSLRSSRNPPLQP